MNQLLSWEPRGQSIQLSQLDFLGHLWGTTTVVQLQTKHLRYEQNLCLNLYLKWSGNEHERQWETFSSYQVTYCNLDHNPMSSQSDLCQIDSNIVQYKPKAYQALLCMWSHELALSQKEREGQEMRKELLHKPPALMLFLSLLCQTL